MYIKALLGALVFAALCWFGWWWIAAGAAERGLAAWFEDRRGAGWQADYADLTVAGFPNRLDTELTDVDLADPVSGWAWSGPRLAIYQLVYDPAKAIIVWPEEQRVAAPGARATVRSEEMRASIAFGSVSALSVDRNSVEIIRGAVAADAGWTASVDKYIHHIRLAAPDIGPENTYHFRVDADQLRPPDFIKRLADPAGTLPPAIRVVAIEGKAALDRPLDRFALEGRKPQIAALSLSEALFEWGVLRLTVSGAARADENGYAEGDFTVSARNWEDMLDAAVAAGVIGESLAETLKTGLGFVARLGGDRKELNATLTFSGGFTKFGPVPIGPAPQMMRRAVN